MFEVVMMAKLTPKQQMFVEEYLIDLNATQAAIRAGYSVKNAGKIGPELLGKTRIKQAVDKALAARSRRTGITQDRVLAELAKIAFADMSTFVRWGPDGITLVPSDTLDGDDTACVSEISEVEIQTDFGTKKTTKIKLHDKRAALEALGKHLGLFKDNGGPVEIALADLLRKAWDVVTSGKTD